MKCSVYCTAAVVLPLLWHMLFIRFYVVSMNVLKLERILEDPMRGDLLPLSFILAIPVCILAWPIVVNHGYVGCMRMGMIDYRGITKLQFGYSEDSWMICPLLGGLVFSCQKPCGTIGTFWYSNSHSWFKSCTHNYWIINNVRDIQLAHDVQI